MDDLFGAFDRANEDAQALVPAVRTLLDPASDAASRAQAVADIRASGASVDEAVRTFSDDDGAGLTVARAIFEAALAEPGSPDLVREAQSAVEKAVALGQHEVAVALAERALDAAPESISLSLMLANVHANRGEFVPARLEALCPREMPVGLRRRLHANLGVALLAVGRVAEGLEALRRAAADAATWMSPDSPVGWAAEPALIQPMRQLLQLDGTGERAASWGVGGLRMVVLLDGLAGATVDPQHAELLRTEAETRQRAIFEHFAADPDEPHVTLAEVVEDAADYARVLSLEATAARLSALR